MKKDEIAPIILSLPFFCQFTYPFSGSCPAYFHLNTTSNLPIFA